MGNRVSISFQNGNKKSVVLFNHWGGREFALEAFHYAAKLKAERQGYSSPLDRLEPDTVMVDFIREITKDLERVEKDLHLGATQADGDNSDHGHFTIDLTNEAEGKKTE